MQHPRTPFARRHLWLVSVPIAHGPADGLTKRMEGWLAARVACLSTLFARWATALALLPVLIRRATLRRQPRRRPVREARIIPFQPRRRAAR